MSRNAHLAKFAFKPGQSGNPAGKPLGARQKFGEAFMKDALAVWEVHGKAALEKMAQKKPTDFVKAMVIALPKNIVHESMNSELDGMSPDDIRDMLELVRALKAKQINGTITDTGDHDERSAH